MTNYIRVILGVVFLGCLVSSYLFFANQNKRDLEENIRLEELELLSLSSSSKVISILKELNKEGRLSLKEKIFLTELQLESPEGIIDQELLSFLVDNHSDSTDVLVINTCYSFREGNSSAILEQLKELVLQYPDNLRASYEYNRRAFINLGIEGRLQAKKQLQNLSRGKGRWSYKALQVLCFAPPLHGYLKEDILASIDLLQSHILVTSIDFLKGCELKMILNENYQIKDFISEIERVLYNEVKLLDYATWLLKFGLSEKVLSIVSDKTVHENSGFFFIRFMAFLETENYDGAQSLILKNRPSLSKDEFDRAKAYLKIASGDDVAFQELIKSAPTESVVNLLTLSRIALFKGLANDAMSAFDRAWETDPNAFSLSQANQYLQLSLAGKQTLKAHTITQNLNSRYPYKLGNTNNYCYLSLLLGIDVPKARNLIDSTIRTVPNNPSFLSTLALANLLEGDPKQALKDMQTRGIPHLVHSERALLAVIFHKLGDIDEAEKMAASVPISRLLPEELKLLQDHDLVMKR